LRFVCRSPFAIQQLLELDNCIACLADEYGCIVTKGALAKLKRCTFVISSSSESGDRDVTTPKSIDGSDSNSKRYSAVGVGVFVTKNKAVTAAHNLDTDNVVGSTVRVVLPEVKTELVLRVHVRDDGLDIAVLEFDGEHEHLDLYTGQLSTLVGQRLAMCSYMLGVEEELEEFSRTMAVSAAYVNKESRHGNHIVYQSNAWPGDSGAAVVLRDGQLLGVHVAGVNALREKFEKMHSIAERLNAVEESLEAAARSIASGCVAVTVKAFVKHLE
jgi:hypothetical protein